MIPCLNGAHVFVIAIAWCYFHWVGGVITISVLEFYVLALSAGLQRKQMLCSKIFVFRAYSAKV